MKQLYLNGFEFEYGSLKFRKLDDNAWGTWVCLNSTYIKTTVNADGSKSDELRYESELPLFKVNGELNRYGFKLPDEQVKVRYNLDHQITG